MTAHPSDDEPRPAMTPRSHPDLAVWAGHLDEHRRCPRQFSNRIALGIPSPEPVPEAPAASLGKLTHRELEQRHERWDAHDGVALLSEPPAHHAQAVEAHVRAHLALCPAEDDARYHGGERVLATRLHDLQVVVLAIVDAVWEHPDGVIELRDYKTGAGAPTPDQDAAALVHALLGRTHWPDRQLRVTYERLADEPTTAELAVTGDTIDAALSALTAHVAALREGRWEARPGTHCQWCDYRRSCPSSLAPGEHPS